MAAIIKRAQLFIGDNKIAELQTVNKKGATNGERAHGADGVIGFTTGNPELDFTANTCIPVAPKAGLTALRNAFRTQAYVTMSFVEGSDVITTTCKCVSETVTSEAKNGTLGGEWVLSNAEDPVYS